MAVVNEAVAEVAEQVATEALEVAEISRGLDGRALGLGIAVGIAVGAGTAWFLAEKKLRGKYEALAEAEIQQMREHFHAKAVAMEGKPALDGLVQDLGYVPIEADADRSAEASAPSAPGEINTTVEPRSQLTEQTTDDQAEERN